MVSYETNSRSVRKLVTLTILFVIGLILLFGILSSLQRFVKISDVKNYAEERIGSLLRARVRVNEVKVGFLDHISLRGLRIDQEIKNKVFYLLDIKKVVFKYNLDRFWRRHFESPNTVLLDSPRFVFRTLPTPLDFLNIDRILKDWSRLADELQFKEGKVSFSLPNYPVRFDLAQIQGSLKRMENNVWHIAFEGLLNQLFEGVMLADGIVDLDENESSIRILLKDMNSTRPDELPIRDVQGKILLTKEGIHFEEIVFQYARIPIRVHGFIHMRDINSPEIDLTFSLGSKDFGTTFNLKGSLLNSNLRGDLEFAKGHIALRGKLRAKKKVFLLEDLQIGEGFSGQGEFNFGERMCHFYLERDKQRTDIKLNLKNWDIDFSLQEDHLPFFGTDLVCRSRFELRPDSTLWNKNQWAFDGKLQTDYLILDQVPFPDFRGTFHLISNQIDRMNFKWGEGYELEGQMDLRSPFPINASIHLKEINLEQLNSILSHPLPESFKGVADGSIKIRGEDWKVEVEGAIAVSSGTIGGFDYDQISLSFHGIPPYLKLQNSRLTRGMQTFYLDGGIDLSRKNIFQDIKASSSERIVVWNGQDLSHKAKESFMIRGIGHLADVSRNKGKGAEVSGKKEEDEESYVVVGPKFKF